MALPAENSARLVAFEFKDFRTFLNSFSANIGRGGMYVGSVEPEEPGTHVEFRIALAGGDPLLQGRAEVAWVAAGEDLTPGMGLRFLEIEAEGQHLIERIEEIRIQSGRELFDIERGAPPNQASRAREDATHDLLRAEIESLKQAHLEEQGRQSADLDAMRLERDQLATELSAAQESAAGKDYEALEADHQSLRAEAEAARRELEQLQEKVGAQAADLTRFTEQGQHAMAERDRLETKANELTVELGTAQSEIERLREEGETAGRSSREANELRRLLDEERSASSAAREEADEMRTRFERATEKNLELAQQLNLQSSQDTASGERVAELEGERDAAVRELEVLREGAASATRDLDTIRQERDAAVEARDEAERAADELRKAARKAERVAERVRGEHAKLQEDLAEAQATLEEREGTSSDTGAPADDLDVSSANWRELELPPLDPDAD